MSYSKTNWADYAQPALSAANLNKIETGISDAHALRGSAHVSEFGAVGNGSTNDSAAIQAAIDYVSSQGGGWVELDAKTYIADGLVRRGLVSLRGRGGHQTVIKPPSGSSNTSVLRDPIGPIQRSNIVGIWFENNGNAGQDCLHFQAQADPAVGNAGGWWHSYLSDVTINKFARHNIWLRGGASGFLLPCQLIEMYHVVSWAANSASGRALTCTGQVGQINCFGCEFDGTGKLGTNIELSREYTGGGGSLAGGSAVGSNSCYSVDFYGTTIQAAALGVYMDSVQDINFWGPHCESLYRFANAEVNCFGVNIRGGHFADAASDGSGGGYIARSANGSEVSIDGANVTGTTDKMTVVSSATMRAGSIWSGSTSAQVASQGLTGAASAAATLNLKSIPTWRITSTGTAVSTINATIPVGGLIHLMSGGGSVSYNQSGNIWLGGRTSPLSVGADATATFVRQDLGATWNLIAVSSG